MHALLLAPAYPHPRRSGAPSLGRVRGHSRLAWEGRYLRGVANTDRIGTPRRCHQLLWQVLQAGFASMLAERAAGVGDAANTAARAAAELLTGQTEICAKDLRGYSHSGLIARTLHHGCFASACRCRVACMQEDRCGRCERYTDGISARWSGVLLAVRRSATGKVSR